MTKTLWIPQPNVKFISPHMRTPDGGYEIDPGVTHVHPFEIGNFGQLRVPFSQCRFRQSFSIRGWISTDPYGPELYNNFRWHPGEGGMAHLFYDKKISPPPCPVKGQPQINQFSEILFQPGDILIPLDVGKYFYQVQNCENFKHCYNIGFYGECCPPDLQECCPEPFNVHYGNYPQPQ